MTHPQRRPRGAPLDHEPEAVEFERKRAGLTKREAARRTDISEQLWGLIESGQRNATPPVLRRMAEALNCPIVVLEAKRPTVTTEVA